VESISDTNRSHPLIAIHFQKHRNRFCSASFIIQIVCLLLFEISEFLTTDFREMKVFWRDRPVEKGSWLQWVKQAFLPEGYPNSVTPDYLEYQKFDTIQAMSSSLVGSLASAGMLKAAGVGDAEATALGSAMNFLLGDLVGMVTQILFAWLKSSSLDAFSKQVHVLTVSFF
jgi:hypothetical protein